MLTYAVIYGITFIFIVVVLYFIISWDLNYDDSKDIYNMFCFEDDRPKKKKEKMKEDKNHWDNPSW